MPDSYIPTNFTITILILKPSILPYPEEKFNQVLQCTMGQEYVKISRIVVVEIPPKEAATYSKKAEVTPGGANVEMIALQSRFQSSSELLKASLEHVQGEYVLLINCLQNPVYLKKSASCVFIMALQRSKEAGMAYADYNLNTEGTKRDIHLLEYHEGRVRDNLDLGYVTMFPASILTKINIPDNLHYATLYDLRLKISERYALRHISNRYDGGLYCVESSPKKHNVFDYLQDAKESQLEMEKILNSHLQRIGSYLEPETHYKKIKYEDDEIQSGNPLVSVIIPVNRRPEFIGTAIESVFAQTAKDKVEILVMVNGGEDDPTVDAVKPYLAGGKLYSSANPPVRMVVVDINNIGLCLNLGMQIAKGKYYLQLDSDDRLKPDAVAKVLDAFAQDPLYIAMVIGSYEVWEKKSDGTIVRREDIPVVKHEEWTVENGRNNLLRINGAGAPRAYYIKIAQDMGGFSVNDEPYSRNYGEDYDMILKLSETYRIARIWEPIYEVVRHSGGTDHSIDQTTIDRNDNAKDQMRLEAIKRRKKLPLDFEFTKRSVVLSLNRDDQNIRPSD